MEIPTIYCLSFSQSERRHKMRQRFAELGLLDYVIFNQPISSDDRIIYYYLQDRPGDYNNEGGRKCASCTLSHLASIKDFAKFGGKYGIFCEDDIHLRKTFIDDIAGIIRGLQQIPAGQEPKSILLGYLLNTYPVNSDVFSRRYTLGKFEAYTCPSDVWGTQMFMLSRDAAVEIIAKYDKPFKDSVGTGAYGADWIYTKQNPRIMLYPMLAVEEGNVATTDIHQILYHRLTYDMHWNITEYTL